MGGGEKCLLPLGPTSILHRIISTLAPQVSHIVINSNSDPARFAETGLKVIADSMPGRLGPLAGILAAMRWAQSLEAQNVITVACDTPFLPGDLVYRLVTRADGGVAVAASGGQLHGATGLWPTHHADRLAGELNSGSRRVGAWLSGLDFSVVEYPSSPADPFWNINTPAEWEEAQRLAS